MGQREGWTQHCVGEIGHIVLPNERYWFKIRTIAFFELILTALRLKSGLMYNIYLSQLIGAWILSVNDSILNDHGNLQTSRIVWIQFERYSAKKEKIPRN
jgi:hypothetical protein